MPRDVDPQLWAMFESVDTDRSGYISATELQRALMNGDWTPFDLDTVKLLLTIFDTDRSGTIGYKEFAGVWKYINDWQNVFKTFDRDRSGTIDINEFRDALSQFGYNLNSELMTLLEKKYAVSTGHGRAPAGIPFDRFLRACVGVKQLTDTFRQHDTSRSGWIQLNYDTFMKIVLSAP